MVVENIQGGVPASRYVAKIKETLIFTSKAFEFFALNGPFVNR
jgi:hypothetical protein